MSRYTLRSVTDIDLRVGPTSMHKNFLEKRGIKRLAFYTTPKFLEITQKNIEDIPFRTHIWSSGDRFYKIAAEEYGDPTLWWYIAYFNQKPTDFHVKLGEQIMVPKDTTLIESAINR